MGRYSEAIIGRRGELASALDSIPELRGAGIGIHDGENQVSSVIRDSNHGSRLRTFVVIEVVVDDIPTPDSMLRGGSSSQRRYCGRTTEDSGRASKAWAWLSIVAEPCWRACLSPDQRLPRLLQEVPLRR